MGGMTAGALIVGGAFEAIGVDAGTFACAATVALAGVVMVARRPRSAASALLGA
jgi:hypothetical protein